MVPTVSKINFALSSFFLRWISFSDNFEGLKFLIQIVNTVKTFAENLLKAVQRRAWTAKAIPVMGSRRKRLFSAGIAVLVLGPFLRWGIDNKLFREKFECFIIAMLL